MRNGFRVPPTPAHFERPTDRNFFNPVCPSCQLAHTRDVGPEWPVASRGCERHPFGPRIGQAGHTRKPSRTLRYTMTRSTLVPLTLLALSAVSAGCHKQWLTCNSCEPPPCCGPVFAPPPACSSCGSSPIAASPGIPGFKGPVGQPVSAGFPVGGYPVSSGYPMGGATIVPSSNSIFTGPPTQIVPPPQVVPGDKK